MHPGNRNQHQLLPMGLVAGAEGTLPQMDIAPDIGLLMTATGSIASGPHYARFQSLMLRFYRLQNVITHKTKPAQKGRFC